MKQLIKFLKEEKGFVFVEEEKLLIDDEIGIEYIDGKFNDLNCTLRIISVDDGSNNICSNKLENAKNQVLILKECNHKNIIQCYDSFLNNTYFAIILERIDQNLEKIMDYYLSNQVIYLNRTFYINLALQILNGIEFIHSKNWVLKNFSLKNIIVNQSGHIKFLEFGICRQINLAEVQQQLTVNAKEVIYFDPQIIKLAKESTRQNQLYFDSIEGDIWKVGVLLYIIAGASVEEVYNLSQGEHSFQVQSRLDPDINSLLQGILQIDPSKRMQISDIKKSFMSYLKMNQYIERNKQEDEEFKCYTKFVEANYKCQYQSAIDFLNILGQKNPKFLNDNYYAQIGQFHFQLNQLEESIQWSEKSLFLNKENWNAQYNLGQAYYSLNIFKQSIKCLKKAISFCKFRNHNLILLLGRAYYQIKKYDKVLSLFSENLVFNQVYIPHLRWFAFSLYKQNQFVQCREFYKLCLKYLPDDISILQNIACCYDELKEYDQAIDIYLQILQQNPNQFECLFNLGIAYLNQQNNTKALEIFMKANELYPNDSEILMHIGSSYKKLEQYQEALKYYSQSLEINPHFEDVLLHMATIFFQLEEQEEMVQYYKKVITINPKNKLALNALSNFYFKEGQINVASIYLKKHNLDQINERELSKLAIIKLRKQMLEQSIRLCKRLLQVNPNEQNIDRLKSVKEQI